MRATYVEDYNGDKLQFEVIYEKSENSSIRIWRVFGSDSVVILPDHINGNSVDTIGSYCFASVLHLPQSLLNEYESVKLETKMTMHELCGDCITNVICSDTITCIEHCAFYNCWSMTQLTIGRKLTDIHSDAFMNCNKFHQLSVRAQVSEATGIRYILNQVSSEVEVTFLSQNSVCARLLYPEYSESYEEIGPAHIFGLSVTGEGYRARQQFKDDVLDLNAYDDIFEKAINEENLHTLFHMAIDRLMYPIGIKEKSKQRFQNYIKENADQILEQLVIERNLDAILFLCQDSVYVTAQAVEKCVRTAVEQGWTRGSAAIIRCRQKQSIKSRYSF